MPNTLRRSGRRLFRASACVTIGLLTASRLVAAQGCEPIRFSSPSLGGRGESYQAGGEWRLTIDYRNLSADQWFVGSAPRNDLSLMKTAPVININTLVAGVSYAVSDRLNLRVTVPLSGGRMDRLYADGAWHQQSAMGLGDISANASYWVFKPSTHREGNLGFAVGLKAPTGSNHVASHTYTATSAVPFAADQAIQLGDGGWAVTLETEFFREILDRTYVYVSGMYSLSLQERTDVEPSPGYGTTWSTPDTYSARAGFAFSLWPDQGLSVSFGGRVDGDPVRDVIGGGDMAARRPGYVFYADPGLSLTRGRDNFTLSVPLRVSANRLKSLWEEAHPAIVAGGDFAKLVVFAGYSHRF